MKNKSKKRVKKFIRALSRIAVLLILVAVIISIVFLSGIFNIKSINITIDGKSSDGEHLSKAEIKSLSGISVGQNTFQTSKNEIINSILENPYVKNVTLSGKFTGNIKIDVKERKVKYLVKYAASYIYIDSQGYILEVSSEEKDVPVLLGVTTDFASLADGSKEKVVRLNEEDLEKFGTLNSIMDTAKNNDVDGLISRIDITDKHEYIVYLDSESKTVYLGDCSDLNTRILYMKAIIKKESGKTGEIFINVDLDTEYVYFRESV